MKPPHNGSVLSLGNSTSTAVSREIRTTWKANSISRPHPIYPVRSTYSATPTTTDFLNKRKSHHHIMAAGRDGLKDSQHPFTFSLASFVCRLMDGVWVFFNLRFTIKCFCLWFYLHLLTKGRVEWNLFPKSRPEL